MNPVLQKLRENNIDTDLVIKKRFLGREEMYYRFLERLREDKNFDILKEKLALNDVGGAFRAGHTLKGVLESLGLSPMIPNMIEIVEILRQGSTQGVDELMEQAQLEYDRIQELMEK